LSKRAIDYIIVARATMGASRSNDGVSPSGDVGQGLHSPPELPEDKEAPVK